MTFQYEDHQAIVQKHVCVANPDIIYNVTCYGNNATFSAFLHHRRPVDNILVCNLKFGANMLNNE